MFLTMARRFNPQTASIVFQTTGLRSMSSFAVDLKGVFPPIATPFNSDESIAWDKLKSNIDRLNKEPLRGFLVQGSNGEYCFLSKEERIEMIRKVREFASPDKLVLAGSGCESTRQTIEMTNAMAEAGADAAVVITPCYFKAKMNNAALVEHFKTVAEQSTIPVILYSVPANTSIDLAPEVVAELAKHPNIIGMKDSGGDVAKIGKMVYDTRNDDFQVLAGSASFLLPALHLGSVGGICALANVLPGEVCELQRLFDEQKADEAKALQHRLIAPNGAVTKRFGVPGLKQAMEWFGFYGGPTRKPLLPLTKGEEEGLRQAFTSTGFL